MSAHMPGPWKASDIQPWRVLDSGGYLVADCGSCRPVGPDVQAADARLIAAAPDLLEALIDMVQRYDPHGEEESGRLAQAIIRKATGEGA